MDRIRFCHMVKGLCPGIHLKDMIDLAKALETRSLRGVEIRELANQLRMDSYRPFSIREIDTWVNRIDNEITMLELNIGDPCPSCGGILYGEPDMEPGRYSGTICCMDCNYVVPRRWDEDTW